MKSLFRLCLLLIFLNLSGCSVTDGLVENYILEKTGVLDSTDYITYLENYENGKVDKNGYWITQDEVETDEEGVHISFVSNNHFDISYFNDKELTNLLSTENCYLSPGDSIYVSKPKIKNILETSYQFNEFEIYTFEDGKKNVIATVPEDSGLIYTIPSDFTGSTISICPIGEFLPCTINFHIYIQNENSKDEVKDITWSINRKKVIGNQFSFIPNSAFTIEASYPESDTKKYYLLDSNVEPNYYDDIKGIVRFENIKTSKQNLNYYMVVKEYTTVKFNNKKDMFSGIKATATYNNETKTLEKETTDLGKFQNNDEIVFSLEKGYTLNVNGLTVSDIQETENGDRITVKITKNSPPETTISIKKKTSEKAQISDFVENGVMSIYHDDGSMISDEEHVELSEKIEVRITPNSGYYITGKNVKDNVYSETMKFSTFKKKTEDIISKHKIKKYITVTLNEDDDHGVCSYFIGKEKISGTLENLKENDVIKMNYSLTDENYKYSQFNLRDTKTKNIKITEEMNNITISRKDYIQIEKKD